MFKNSISGDYSYEHRVIEQPTFLTINGQKAEPSSILSRINMRIMHGLGDLKYGLFTLEIMLMRYLLPKEQMNLIVQKIFKSEINLSSR